MLLLKVHHHWTTHRDVYHKPSYTRKDLLINTTKEQQKQEK